MSIIEVIFIDQNHGARYVPLIHRSKNLFNLSLANLDQCQELDHRTVIKKYFTCRPEKKYES